jgi:hypothetical protein
MARRSTGGTVLWKRCLNSATPTWCASRRKRSGSSGRSLIGCSPSPSLKSRDGARGQWGKLAKATSRKPRSPGFRSWATRQPMALRSAPTAASLSAQVPLHLNRSVICDHLSRDLGCFCGILSGQLAMWAIAPTGTSLCCPYLYLRCPKLNWECPNIEVEQIRH